ncbi:MAG TPA: hypothetical protein VMF88_08765 [Bacteroidota bacterium]|nr:hypothetical protein [Bacteroidota bacterium]
MKSLIILAVSVIALGSASLGQIPVPPLRYTLSTNPGGEISPLSSPVDNTPGFKKKSQAVAVLYSLILPGMGEWYADGFSSGRYSLTAEAALWLTYASFEQYGSWFQSDARQYAAAHSGALLGGKNDQFFVNMGNFDNVYQYNDQKLRERDLVDVYDPASGYFWSWDTDADRLHFRSMRVSGDKIFNNAKFVLGAVLLNHIVSAVNAARLVRHYNKNAVEGLGSWQLEPNLNGETGQIDGMRLTYTQRF